MTARVVNTFLIIGAVGVLSLAFYWVGHGNSVCPPVARAVVAAQFGAEPVEVAA